MTSLSAYPGAIDQLRSALRTEGRDVGSLDRKLARCDPAGSIRITARAEAP